MKVTILSLSQAINYIPEYRKFKQTALISIVDGGYSIDELRYDYRAKLTLNFYNIEPKESLLSNWNYFSEKDGNRLLSFFEDIQAFGFNELVIHCHAGISRSPVIALAYAWFSGDDDLEQIIIKEKYIPNKQVLRVRSKLLGLYEEKKELIEQPIISTENGLIIEF